MIKLLVCAALATSATAAGVVAASAAPAAPPSCVSVNLVPSYGGFQGAAGTFQDTWRLRNVGPGPCRLSGYPSVNNYRGDGRPLPTTVTRLGTAHWVTLLRGQHASFALRYTDPGVLNCRPEPAAMLTILAPRSLRPLIVDRGEKACGGRLQETPLVHGG